MCVELNERTSEEKRRQYSSQTDHHRRQRVCRRPDRPTGVSNKTESRKQNTNNPLTSHFCHPAGTGAGVL